MKHKLLSKVTRIGIRICLVIIILLSISIILDIRDSRKTPGESKTPVATTTVAQESSTSYDIYLPEYTIPDDDKVTLRVTPMADSLYLEDSIFIGDSRTVGLDTLSLIPSYNSFAVNGINHINYQSTYFSDSVTGAYGTIGKIVAYRQPERIYVALGINSAAYMDAAEFIASYRPLIEALIENSPDSIIIIESILPVSSYYEMNHPSLTNSKIAELNSHLYALASELELYYLNVTEAMSDPSTNALISEFDGGDGLHFSDSGYHTIIDYIMTHTIESEDNRVGGGD